MTKSSLTDIGLIFMVNILLISNYFFVRALRKAVDSEASTVSNDDRRNAILIRFRERFASSRFIIGFGQSSTTVPASNSEDKPAKKCTLNCFQNTAFACVFGRHRLEPSLQKTFPGWKPIPYKMGILSTCFALLLTIVLLSTEIVEDRISVTPPMRSESDSDSIFDSCDTNEKEKKIFNFNNTMTDLTKYDKVRKQTEAISSFTVSLLSDISDYGTENDSGCSGNKAQYERENKHNQYGPFFPAFCPEARELSLVAANETCAKKDRVCTEVLSCNATETPIVCLPHSNDADATNTINYRVEQLKKLAEQSLKQDMADQFDQDELEEKSAAVVGRLLKQINIAGTLYSIYVCVGLFFPSPLRLYRPSLSVRAKQILFGADKNTFIIIALIGWWVYQYIDILISYSSEHSREIKAYVQNFVKDPCFLDASFLTERYKIWNEMCGNLTSMENEWELAKVQINQIKPEVEAFESCNCSFSGNSLQEFSNQSALLYDEVEFNYTTWNVMMGGEKASFWAPNENSAFLGNTTVCENMEHAKDYILIGDDDVEINFWDAWIRTGLLANLLVKVAITNFCVALLNLADPFVTCGGTYESPPKMLDHDDDDASDDANSFKVSERVKKDKGAALMAIAVRQSLFWGIISNACLFCLLIVAVSNFGDFNDTDYIVFTSLIMISFSVPCCCFFLTHCMGTAIPNRRGSQYESSDVENGFAFPIPPPSNTSRPSTTLSTRPTRKSENRSSPTSTRYDWWESDEVGTEAEAFGLIAKENVLNAHTSEIEKEVRTPDRYSNFITTPPTTSAQGSDGSYTPSRQVPIDPVQLDYKEGNDRIEIEDDKETGSDANGEEPDLSTGKVVDKIGSEAWINFADDNYGKGGLPVSPDPEEESDRESLSYEGDQSFLQDDDLSDGSEGGRASGKATQNYESTLALPSEKEVDDDSFKGQSSLQDDDLSDGSEGGSASGKATQNYESTLALPLEQEVDDDSFKGDQSSLQDDDLSDGSEDGSTREKVTQNYESALALPLEQEGDDKSLKGDQSSLQDDDLSDGSEDQQGEIPW